MLIVKENDKPIGTIEMNYNIICYTEEDESKCKGIARIKRGDIHQFVLMEYDSEKGCPKASVIDDETAFRILCDYNCTDLLQKYFPDGSFGGTKLPKLEKV